MYTLDPRRTLTAISVLVGRFLPLLVATMLVMVTLAPIAALVAPTMTFAQALDAGVPSAALVVDPAPPLPTDYTDVAGMLRIIYYAATHKQWGLLIALVVLLAVAAMRKWLPPDTKLGALVKSKLGGIVTNLALTASSGFAVAFATGHAMDLELGLSVLSVSLTAAGGWAIYKNLIEAWDELKAQKAGLEATKDPANTLLNK